MNNRFGVNEQPIEFLYSQRYLGESLFSLFDPEWLQVGLSSAPLLPAGGVARSDGVVGWIIA
jgi:hypothetical protein